MTAFFSLIVILCVLLVAGSLFELWCGARVFKKAGQAPWAIIVPIWNLWVWMKVGKLPVWAFVAELILVAIACTMEFMIDYANPVYGLIILLWIIEACATAIMCWMYWGVGKNFGQSVAFRWGLILVPVVFIPILALDKNIRYNEAPANNFE